MPRETYFALAAEAPDIGNTTKIRAVIANGRYFSCAQLDALVADGERQGRGRTP